MSLETVPIEHIPPSYTVYLSLYRNVENAAFLHQQLLDRNAHFEYAFIDASVVWQSPCPSFSKPCTPVKHASSCSEVEEDDGLTMLLYSTARARLQVVSRRQLLSAVFKAVTSAATGALKTPNVHSEIVLSLNPSNNVSKLASLGCEIYRPSGCVQTSPGSL